MRALTLIYHEDLEPEITGIIQHTMLIARYTKIRDVIGARTDIMQEVDYSANGKNHMLIIVATQEVIQELAQALRVLRQVKGHGLRGYITPVEGLI
jgi:excinuclease UvrABC helicase subunit UvrB